MQSPTLDFDPYRVWLGISDSRRLKTAYDLLAVPPLETNEAKIRAASERQRVALARVASRSDPVLWQKIADEVELAIATLEDPDRKAVLDAEIRRRQSAVGGERTSGKANSPLTAEIACRKCQKRNSGARRFCTDCGGPLWEQCFQCGGNHIAGERFCGACGADVQGNRTAKRQELELLLREGEQLASEHRYDSAFARFKDVATITDLNFLDLIDQAVTALNGLEERKAQAHSEARLAYERSQQLVLNFNFEQAMSLLGDVHANLRTPEINDLLASATSMRDECLRLIGEIREAVASKQFWDLLPKIDRLLKLKPNQESARKLAEQLRDQIVLRTKGQISQRQYEAALGGLASIPEFARNKEVETLNDQVRELDCLATALRTAPLADEAALALGKRFAQAVPGDVDVADLVKKLETRSRQRPTDKRLTAANWASPPRQMALGVPVDWLGGLTHFKCADATIQNALLRNPGCFGVAVGLALDGVGAAALSIDLQPPREKEGLLTALSIPFQGKRVATTAWGLDLSPAGLKAVKLGYDRRNGGMQLLAADYIAHAKPLTHPEADLEKQALVTQTLQTFLEKHKVDKAETFVGGIAGHQTLGRFFELPPMPAKKIPSAIEYEAGHQIPIPLAELAWGNAIVNASGAKDSDAQRCRVVVVAARRFYIEKQVSVFEGAGIKLHSLQCDCVALHNSMIREFSASNAETNGLPDTSARCFVDVGVDGTNFVVHGPQAVWFRSIRQGIHDLVANMTKEFRLTYSQSELLVREPHRAPRLHKILELWQPWMTQLRNEAMRSIEAWNRLYPQMPVSRVYGLGGGFRTFGLLRHLRAG